MRPQSVKSAECVSGVQQNVQSDSGKDRMHRQYNTIEKYVEQVQLIQNTKY